MDQHFLFSSFREKLIEHIFIAELLKLSWRSGKCALEIARPEVDSRGYDLIVESEGVVRHIQLKASHRSAMAGSQKVHSSLAQKPSGCVVWIVFDEQTLELGPFLFLGADAGLPMAALEGFGTAKHTKGDSTGFKSERDRLRVVPKSRFTPIPGMDGLYAKLFFATA